MDLRQVGLRHQAAADAALVGDDDDAPEAGIEPPERLEGAVAEDEFVDGLDIVVRPQDVDHAVAVEEQRVVREVAVRAARKVPLGAGIVGGDADIDEVTLRTKAGQVGGFRLGLEIIFFKGETFGHFGQGIALQQIDAAVDQPFGTGPFFPEGGDPPFSVERDFPVTVKVAERLERQRGLRPALAVEGLHGRVIDAEERVAVEDEHRVLARLAQGQPHAAAGAQRLFFHDAGDAVAVRPGGNPGLHGFVLVAEREDDVVEAGFPQVIEQPGQERPAGDGRHAFGQVGHDAAQARPLTAGEHHAFHYFPLPKMLSSTRSQRM